MVDENAGELLRKYDPAQPDFDLYPELHRVCPVAAVGDHVWLISRYKDVLSVALDDDSFPSGPAFGYPDGIPEEGSPEWQRTPMTIPIMLDPPEFWKYRRLLNPLFSPEQAVQREPDARGIVTNLIDAFIESGAVDFHSQLAKPMPAILTCRLLGCPEDEWSFFADPVHHMLHDADRESDSLYSRTSSGESGRGREWDLLKPAVDAMIEIANERRKDPRADILTFLVNAEVDGRPLNDYEIGGIAILVVIGGVDTTTGAIASALVHMARHPEIRQQLVDDPALIPVAVEEFLRFLSPVQSLPRAVSGECELGGQQLESGDVVSMMWGAANRDEQEFPNASEFVLERDPNRHLAFGIGIHRCLGSNLARMEFRVALEEILRRIPQYELVEAGVRLQPNAAVYGYAEVSRRSRPGRGAADTKDG